MADDIEKKDEILTQEEWLAFLRENFAKMSLPFLPTQKAVAGIRYDFCRGARVFFPAQKKSKEYHLRIVDLDNSFVLYDGILQSGDYYVAPKHYYIRYGIQITEHSSGKPVFQHKMDLHKKKVLIKFPVNTLGDTIAWMPAVEKFQTQQKCSVYLRIADYIRPLFEHSGHEDMQFITNEQLPQDDIYAAYTLAIFHDDSEKNDAPTDYRNTSLHVYGCDILGVSADEVPPMVSVSPEGNANDMSPYVCIATQASGGCKMWNNPTGWETVVEFLKKCGYRVLDIDKHPVCGENIFWNKIPRNADDYTGDKPLTERCSLIAGADFFIGLGSGLSWLAWCMNKPVVLISGFSEQWAEFYTPYRVINKNVCHGCFNDLRYKFDSHDYLWCPLHKGTARHWECQKAITAQMVIDKIKEIPVFKKRMQEMNNQKGEK